MSMLRSALEEIQGRDPDRLDEAGLEEGYAELERAADVVLSERLRWLAAIERRGIYARDGHSTSEGEGSGIPMHHGRVSHVEACTRARRERYGNAPWRVGYHQAASGFLAITQWNSTGP
jgi:hypothetical protein